MYLKCYKNNNKGSLRYGDFSMLLQIPVSFDRYYTTDILKMVRNLMSYFD